MTNAKSVFCLMGLLAVASGWGCAPAYDWYSGGCVDCRYCRPVPLPYSYYDASVCHSDAVERYLTLPPQPAMLPETSTESAAEVVPQEETAAVRTVRVPLVTAYDTHRTPATLGSPLFNR